LCYLRERDLFEDIGIKWDDNIKIDIKEVGWGV
jgi:hypothetical protein